MNIHKYIYKKYNELDRYGFSVRAIQNGSDYELILTKKWQIFIDWLLFN